MPHPQTAEAVRHLGINVPVLRVDEGLDGTLTLHLYGGQVRHYKPPTPKEPLVPDVLTLVHGIGVKGAEKLEAAGITTYRQLATAYTFDAAKLSEIFNASTLRKIDAWLEANHYL